MAALALFRAAGRGAAAASPAPPAVRTAMNWRCSVADRRHLLSPPEPGAPAFASVGDVVRKGKVLCIIEAMKLMNEIESESTAKSSRCTSKTGSPWNLANAFRDQGEVAHV